MGSGRLPYLRERQLCLKPALKGHSLFAVGGLSPRRIAQGNALGLKHGNLNKALKGRNNTGAREYGAPLQNKRVCGCFMSSQGFTLG